MLKYICNKKDFKKGLEYIEKALEIDPNSIEIKELEGHLNMHLNNFEKAIDCYQTCLYKRPNDCIYYGNLAYAFSKSNYHIDSRKITEDMNKLKATLNNSSKFNYALSIIKLGQLQYDDFFKHINIALNKGLGMFIGELMGNPIYNEVRKDKRFTLLLKKLNLDSVSKKNKKHKLPTSTITITTKTKEKLTLDPQNIAYIESHGNYAKVFWFEQNILKNKLLRISLSNFEQQLSKVSYIHRCHKSYIININEPLAISGNSKNYFFESNYYPIRIPISRSKSSYFLKLINDDK